MTGALTDLANNLVLDCWLGGVPLKPPPVLYFGLSTSKANRLGIVGEPAGKSYARAVVPNDKDHFPPAIGGVKVNAKPIAWPEPGEMWPMVWAVFVADAPRGGRILATMEIPGGARSFYAGDPAPTIAPGALYLSHT